MAKHLLAVEPTAVAEQITKYTEKLSFGAIGVVGVGALLRLILFPIGQLIELQDDMNFVIGVAAATLIDFVLYDKLVFKKNAH